MPSHTPPIQREKQPAKNFLLLEFSILSFIAFIAIGIGVLSLIRPALETLLIKERESGTVIFVNRHANLILTQDDFSFPIGEEASERMAQFVNNLAIRGLLRIFITDAVGRVIWADPEESIGESLAASPDVRTAIIRRSATARFEKLALEDESSLGVKEAFIQALPITFGGSEKVSGVVYIISRTGLIKKQIGETQRQVGIRVVGGLFFLYSLLFVIVWRASKTIRHQASELEVYAKTLEERVKERTRALEESMGRQIKQAQDLARLKDEFVFVAAHELKAPITHLRWTLGEFFTNKELSETSPVNVIAIMETVRSVTAALSRLVTDLLNVARLESGTVQISVHPTDLLTIIQEAISSFELEAKKQGVTIRFLYDPVRVFPFVLGDSERLKEVFSNLLSNAIKFSLEGGTVEVIVRKSGNSLEADVRDHGIGMSEEELQKLFTKFWRGHPDIEGTGLGLWITKQLVTRMGGELRVESKKGEGSTFSVRLPIAKDRGIKESPHGQVLK